MADQIEMRMNLAAIKKVDPYAKDIIDSSAHVAFYTFNSVENEWEKTDVEGAFFIYCRNAEPFQSIFINNRLNTNSFVEPITGQLELQPQSPFLLYRNERSRIRGFWFYNSAECDRIGDLVMRLIKESELKSKNCSKKNGEAVPKNSNNPVDIFSMLSKAQQNFKISQTMGTTNKNVSIVAGNVKKTSIPPKIESDVTSESVINFFAAAKPASASEVPFFQRLISNPVSVDQIEKQQRATSPIEEKITLTHSNTDIFNDNNVHLKGMPSLPSQQNTYIENSPLAKFLGSSNLGAGLVAATSGNKVVTENKNVQHKLRQQYVKENVPSELLANISKPALMPPTMFATSNSAHKEDLIKTAANERAMELEKQPEPLTQSQLIQAITYLIKNDPGFVSKLHEAYLKSFV